MTFGSEPVSLKGKYLDELEQKAMFEVIERLKAYGFSVHNSRKVLRAALSEISSVVAHEKL